jgi:hypothetical protein
LCTSYCDGNTGCIGVVWTQGDGISQGECTLISGVETNSIIPFNVENNIGPTIYIKLDRVKTHLRLPNRVVLLSDPAKLAADKFTFGLIYRYWINLRNNDMIIARRGDVRSLNFVPTGIINQSNLTGYYSLVPFTPADITNPDFNFYIQYPDQMLAIPSSWAGLVIYAMYI